MLLNAYDEVMLSDFGIAVVTDGFSSFHDFEGTVLYAAPEQIQGRPQRNSDQYALGVVVYEWLCGDWPFSGSFDEVVHQHLFAPPPSLPEKGITVSPAIEHVVMKALAKDPLERFTDIRAFADALETAILEEQVHSIAFPITPPPEPIRQFRTPLPFQNI
jgi:serine/threonine-protein kinase